MPTWDSYLGAGVILPFRRDGNLDFSNSQGVDMLSSSLTVIMGTLCGGPKNAGEVPWNQTLGTLLPLLRHANVNDETTREIAGHYVLDSILRQEPRIKAKSVDFQPRPEDNRIDLRLTYDVVRRDRYGTTALATDLAQEIEV